MKNQIIFAIIISQFFCTSLWFAGNGVMPELIMHFGLAASALQDLTSAVQLGFIVGTLVFALFNVADRFLPSRVFFVSACVASLANLMSITEFNTMLTLIASRFLVGFFLAGIYPVGMKIAADWFDKDLGKSLGFLVGALVLGTALPHLLRELLIGFPWKLILIGTSTLAGIGGLLMMLLVPAGPFRRPSGKVEFSAAFKVFKKIEFRRAAFGYFGHMWELYAFWAFVPSMLKYYLNIHHQTQDASVWSFAIIGVGGMSCFVSGLFANKYGPRNVAFYALLFSCLCCIFSPLIFVLPKWAFLSVMALWGMAVIADSPMFSTLVAKSADSVLKGTALTIVNSIGFAITIVSIQFVGWLSAEIPVEYVYSLLAIGPLLGLLSIYKLRLT